MSDLYRVICTENPEKYPDKLFIDIYPAQFVTHEKLYKMRQMITPEVYDMSGGIYLKCDKENQISLIYIKHYNKALQLQQERLRKRLDPKIIHLFREMQRNGLSQTISASISKAVELFGLDKCRPDNYAQSAQEEVFIERQRYKEERQKRLDARKIYDANQKYAPNPHIKLMIKQKEYSGD